MVLAENPIPSARRRVSTPSQPVVLNPLDPGWDLFLRTHPGSSFFHTAAWAQVLADTYGHRPFYFVRQTDGRLRQLLPVMEVATWLRGPRGISLPFTDFAGALEDDSGTVGGLYEAAMATGRERNWSMLECRGANPSWPGATESLRFHGHVIDLDAKPDELLKRFDSSTRRGIKKAEAAGIRVEFLHTPDAMPAYYQIHCRTRQRHGLPPQPLRFFENIARHVIANGHGMIGFARSGTQIIAGAVFLLHRTQAIYKYGASDFEFQHLRPNNLLMWEAVRRCAADGFKTLHLGRTSLANDGLRRFKMGLGAREETIACYNYDFHAQTFVTDIDRAETWVNNVFRRFPVPLLRMAGEMLYPHLS